MTFHFSNTAASAGNARARANEATLAMTICPGAVEGPTVPWPFRSRGSLLFASAPEPGHVSKGAEHLSQKHGLDIVLSHSKLAGEMAPPDCFSLGVRLFWKVLWHHDLCLWQPENGGPACFVPTAIEDRMYFKVEDGRLTCDERAPFADLTDRARGIRAASAAMARLLINRSHRRRLGAPLALADQIVGAE